MEEPVRVMMSLGKALSLEAAEEIWRLLVGGVIPPEALRDYGIMARENLHSWLQYALIRAAERLGLLAAPEVKVLFSEPLNPEKILPGKKGRKRWLKKVDVGFFVLPKRFIGFGECHTLDEFHGCLSTIELYELINKLAGHPVYDVKRMWITPRDTVMHMVKHAKATWKPEVAVLLIMLPEQLDKRHAMFKDQRLLISKGSDFFLRRWMKMIEDMREMDVDAHLIRLGETGIWVDGELVIDLSPEGLKQRVESWRELASSLEIKPFAGEAEAGWKWISREYAERKLGLR